MSTADEPEGADHVVDLAEVGRLYGDHRARVRRVVSLSVRAGDQVVDDACQVGWTRLVRCHRRVRRDRAVNWVIQVAIHEAWRIARDRDRTVPLELLSGGGGHAVPCAATNLDELAEHQARLSAVRALPERQRELVVLQGLGLSYREMAQVTGDSRRTVERQLARARHTLVAGEAHQAA